MKPPITFRQTPPCPNLSPNQKPTVGAGLGTKLMASPITFLQNPPCPNFDIFFCAIAVENKVGLVVQFGINRLPFGGGMGGFCFSVIGGEGRFRCSVIGGEGGFCFSVIGGYLN